MAIVGINLPWVTCGHDFGPRPGPWGGATASPRDWGPVCEELRRSADAGLSLVRFWVLAGGVNYPVGGDLQEYGTLVHRRAPRRVRRHRALALHSGAPPPPLPSTYLDDFAGLLKAVRRAGLRAIPSLVSFEFFQPAVLLGDGLSKRGRAEFVFGGERGVEVAPFFDAVLEPLLAVARAEADAVHSFELINEPGWSVIGGPLQVDLGAYGLLPSQQLVTGAQMSAFLGEGVDRIASAGMLATIGFADPNPRWLAPEVWRRLRDLAARGQYLHQRHHYPTLLRDHTLVPHGESPITPCMVGEVPTAMGGTLDNLRWRDLGLRATEADPARYLEARLRLIHETRDYPISLLWSARSRDRRQSWGDAQLAQVRRFFRWPAPGR